MSTLEADADLAKALKRERLASYGRLRGGFPVPLAGLIYWLVLGLAGYGLGLADWALLAFFASGAIFPLALLLARLFNNPFMKDRTAVSGVVGPAFVGMLLFWPMIAGAVQAGPELVPLILAIGMSAHWPVIGWSYGRVLIYSSHAIIRAGVVLFIWLVYPEARLTWLPLSVAAVYGGTVLVILIDSARFRTRRETAA